MQGGFLEIVLLGEIAMTIRDIKDRMKDLGVHQFYSFRRETRALPHVIGMDEELYGVTSGLWEGKRWMAAVTGRHIYFVSANPIAKTEVKVIEKKDISAVHQKKGVIFSTVVLELEGTHIELEHVVRASVDQFVRAVRD